MAASYPNAIKIFQTFQDQTQIIYSGHINEIHDEVVALESTIGTNPFVGTPYSSIAGAINDLYLNKAPLAHPHAHSALQGLTNDDHTQYVRTDGSRGFTAPVAAPNAVSGGQLATLGQVTGQGYLSPGAANGLIAAAAAYLVNTRFAASAATPGLFGFPNQGGVGWSLTGGYNVGNTDGSGRITQSLGSAFPTMLLAFIATKVVAPGGGTDPPYNALTASDPTVISGTNTAVILEFNAGATVLTNQQVAYCWVAVGQ